MKTSYKFILKINPNYLNKINENEINDEILLYALENGYDYSKDFDDKFCKFDVYVGWNLKNKNDFINNYIRSKHFSFDKISEDNKIIIEEIFKTKPSLLIKCIGKDIKFIDYLSSKFIVDDLDFNNLVWILKNNNISYSMLNEDFLMENYSLGLEFLKLDFSNIVNFKKYNSNYKQYTNEILDCFSKDIKNNIKYLSEINDLEINIEFQEKIIDVLKNEGILLNSQTPSFIFDNEYVVRNLLRYDLNNSKYINKEVNLLNEDVEYIITKINDDSINFDEIPVCFKNNSKIVFAILKNNIGIIDSQNFDSSLYFDMIVDFVRSGEYKINSNTNKEILEYIGKYFLEQVLELDFNNIKYFENLNVVYTGLPKNLFDILKNNNYSFDKLNKIFSSNPYIIKECLDNNTINIDEINLADINFNVLYEDKLNFKIYIINYAKEKDIIDNEIINTWEKEILNINRKDNAFSSNIYVGGIKNDSLLSYPSDVKEIFSEKNDIESINLLIDRVKASNNNIEKIVVDLPDELYSKEELESIKDKNLVVFGSKKDLTRISVEEMIKIEETLDLFVSDIKASDLSPYERYVAVYNIVKSFKKYKFYNDDEIEDRDYGDQARNVYLIMQNDYIVCVGYARLLQSLLKRVGINCIPWDVMTNTSLIGHERNYVNIVDSKYDIDGYYMCDATWDNIQYEMMKNGYEHLHLTTEESRNENEFNKSSGNKQPNLNDEMFSDYTDEEMLDYLNEGVYDNKNFKKVISIMKQLDPAFYYKIYDKELDFELAKEINQYFKNKLNKEISKEKDIKAIFEINQFIEGKKYTVEEYTEKWNDFIVSNFYSYDMLIGNYNEDINNSFDNLKNMNLREYFILLNDKTLGSYKQMCLREGYYKLSSQFLKQGNETYFGINYDSNNNKLFMSISIDGELFRNEKIDDVKIKLEELGYKVELIGSTNYNIILSNEYLEKTFIETYMDLENIRKDYFSVYNSVLSQTKDM